MYRKSLWLFPRYLYPPPGVLGLKGLIGLQMLTGLGGGANPGGGRKGGAKLLAPEVKTNLRSCKQAVNSCFDCSLYRWYIGSI